MEFCFRIRMLVFTKRLHPITSFCLLLTIRFLDIVFISAYWGLVNYDTTLSIALYFDFYWNFYKRMATLIINSWLGTNYSWDMNPSPLPLVVYTWRYRALTIEGTIFKREKSFLNFAFSKLISVFLRYLLIHIIRKLHISHYCKMYDNALCINVYTFTSFHIGRCMIQHRKFHCKNPLDYFSKEKSNPFIIIS